MADVTMQQALAALDERKQRGELSDFEYNAARKALLSRGGFEVPRAAEAPTPPGGPALPSGWEPRPQGVKLWEQGGRTDDPAARRVHSPSASGVGSGKSFFFLMGFRVDREVDQEFVRREMAELTDDIEALRGAGYTVVVDTQATHRELLEAVYGQGEGAAGLAPAGIYWSAHGDADGAVQTCDGGQVKPDDIDPSRVHPALKLAVFAACYVGAHARRWRKQLGGRPLVVGWGQPVTIDRAVEFLRTRPETDTDLDDLLARYLLADAPVPPELPEASAACAPSARLQGRVGDLDARGREAAIRLGALIEIKPDVIRLLVPLPGGRRHIVSLFLVDSARPYAEGEVLLGAEGEVGPLSALIDVPTLLRGVVGAGFARVALVEGATGPQVVVQGFVPSGAAKPALLAALVYEVALAADALELQIFGTDLR